MSTYNIKNKEILKQPAGNMPYSIPTHMWKDTVALKVAPCANKHVMTDNNHVMIASNYVTVDYFDVMIGKRHVMLCM